MFYTARLQNIKDPCHPSRLKDWQNSI